MILGSGRVAQTLVLANERGSIGALQNRLAASLAASEKAFENIRVSDAAIRAAAIARKGSSVQSCEDFQPEQGSDTGQGLCWSAVASAVGAAGFFRQLLKNIPPAFPAELDLALSFGEDPGEFTFFGIGF